MQLIAGEPEKIAGIIRNSELQFQTIKDENGNEVKLTNENFMIYLKSRDRRVRKDAFEALYSSYDKYKETLAETLQGHVMVLSNSSKLRGFSSSKEASLFSNRVNTKVYDNLIKVVHDRMNVVYDYFKLKKEALKLDDFCLYDTYVNLEEGIDKKYTYEEAKKIVLDVVKVFGEDYQKTVQSAFDNRWIDIYPNKANEIDAQVAFAKEKEIDYVIVTPDNPLALGAVDKFEAAGFKCFGPYQKAAIIESSKAFSKDLMKRYNIPTADYQTFDNEEEAYDYIDLKGAPIVIKADGLALGKGVIIAQTVEEAKEAVKEMLSDKKFGDAGNTIVIEEYLEGPEVSILTFTDGETLKPMISSMDHKRALDNDCGLNTGGMGAIAPNPYYTKEIEEISMKTIFLPTIEAMKKEGRTFKGCLYFSLMLTKDGPKVI